jgi:hypothetical protein
MDTIHSIKQGFDNLQLLAKVGECPTLHTYHNEILTLNFFHYCHIFVIHFHNIKGSSFK